MLSLIIIGLVIVIVVGFFKSLDSSERSIIIKSAINTASVGSVYMFKASKSTVKSAYNIGSIAGMQVSLEGQETLTSVHTYNEDIAKEGGAVKVAVNIANSHSDSIGATDAIKHLAEYKAELKSKLEAARASRA